jgi:hypothetical protein
MSIDLVLQFEMKRLQLIDIERLGYVHEYLVEKSLDHVIHVMKLMFGMLLRGSVSLIKISEDVNDGGLKMILILWNFDLKYMLFRLMRN